MNKNKSVKEHLDEFKNSDLYKTQDKLLKERNKTVKRGSNILHLNYLGEFSESELEEINKKLSNANLELSSFNKSGVIYNSLEEYSLVTYFVIHQPIFIEILKNIGNSAIWDSIKWSLDKAFEFLREQKINENYKIPDYVHYSEKDKKWLKVDVLKEIRAKNLKKKNKALEKVLKEKRKKK